jgi:GNAT superfamily N-acetyltransferase
MAWTLTGSIDEYLAAAGDYLRARPAEHTIELAAAQTLLAHGPAAFGSEPALFGWWRSPAGEVAAAVFHTPPFPMLLSGGPTAAQALAVEVAQRADRTLAGVNGAADAAEAFAAVWQGLTGARSEVQRSMRLFRLGELVVPAPMPPGSARVAGDADRGLLAGWYAAFAAEVHNLGEDLDRDLDFRLSYGGMTIWESGGIPVAMAGLSRPAAGVLRVGPVFTPPEQRRRGYGGAATIAVSQAALDAGAAAVVLFTDLANPTSNALYVRLGYRPLGDRVVLAFDGATGT